ncbi:hypothetical protein ACH5RR_011150 [Cinchona calisaya]|uniref:Uncharacterized protein n=1 Tax=Cinchona calisaya TaxID=153742 RepID=A0ABD3A454_9GENT
MDRRIEESIGRKTEDPSPSMEQRPTTIMDLNMDSLVQCASHLNLQDISNMAVSCKYLKRVAYSDSIWQSLSSRNSRNLLLLILSLVFELVEHDGLNPYLYTLSDIKYQGSILGQAYCFAAGPLIHMLEIGSHFRGLDSVLTLSDHRARITSMRDLAIDVSGAIIVKSQLFQIDCLVKGDDKIFASGGADGTVCLWSSNPKGKRGQHALKSTLYGHEKPIILMSVAGHKSSLLVSMSKDSKMRVWDTSTSSANRYSCCVGMVSVPGAPVGMKCHGSLVYVAAGSSVVSIDLRTMSGVSTVMHQTELSSFDILPSKSLICTGGTGSASLWDMRRSSETFKAKPIAELDGHEGTIKHLHMDAYKIVTVSTTWFWMSSNGCKGM